MIDKRAHGAIDRICGFLAVVPALRHRYAGLKVSRSFAIIGDVAQGIAHAVAQHHRARKIRCADKIIGRAGRYLAEYHLLRRAAAQQHGHFVFQFGLPH